VELLSFDGAFLSLSVKEIRKMHSEDRIPYIERHERQGTASWKAQWMILVEAYRSFLCF
jgi:hypothetical protein